MLIVSNRIAGLTVALALALVAAFGALNVVRASTINAAIHDGETVNSPIAPRR